LFNDSGQTNQGELGTITYTGQCPGQDTYQSAARFFANNTPTARGRRVIIRNLSPNMNNDPYPFTNREYQKGRFSENIQIGLGNSQQLRVFVALPGTNQYEYEIRQGDQVIDQGKFTSVFTRNDKTLLRSASCSQETRCADGSDNLNKCKSVVIRDRCSCPNGNTFFQNERVIRNWR
jgi:hypothetical protein